MAFDKIQFATDLPEYGIGKETTYQTDSLGGGYSTYVITSDGRLIERIDVKRDDQSSSTIERTIEHHGDILLVGKYYYELIVRFTHGRVEWIKRFEHPPGTALDANPEDISLTPEQSAEIKRRIELIDSGKEQVFTWEEARGRIYAALEARRSGSSE